MHRTETAVSNRSNVILVKGGEHPSPPDQEATAEVTSAREADAPQLSSWFMTVVIIAVVSAVWLKHTPH